MKPDLIQPVDVYRDEDGTWLHPNFPEFEGYEEDVPGDVWRAWLAEQGLRESRVTFEDDAPDELVNRYFDDGLASCAEWAPTKPDGEGWFLLGIWDTDDGPVAYWVTRSEDATAGGEREGV